MTQACPRPRPRLDEDNRPFWTGGAQQELLIMHCAQCDNYTHPPRRICRHCQSEEMTPRPVAGTGTIATFTINYQQWLPGLEVPFAIARVALDEVPGVVITSNIVNCGVDEVGFGDRVRVVFEEQQGIWFPLFEKMS